MKNNKTYCYYVGKTYIGTDTEAFGKVWHEAKAIATEEDEIFREVRWTDWEGNHERLERYGWGCFVRVH